MKEVYRRNLERLLLQFPSTNKADYFLPTDFIETHGNSTNC